MCYIFLSILMVSGSFVAQGSDPAQQDSLLGILQNISKKGLKERTDRKDFTPGDLYLAISSENSDMAKSIIEAQPALLHQKYKMMDENDDTGIAPFELATTLYKNKQKPSKKAIKMVQHLLDMGADTSTFKSEKVVPEIAAIMQKHAHKKRLLAPLIEAEKKQRQYEQFEAGSIVIPKPFGKRKTTQAKISRALNNVEKAMGKAEIIDGTELSVEALNHLNGTYQEAKKLHPSCLNDDDTGCAICAELYSKKRPVVVCTSNHVMCYQCFNRPDMQKCPFCRKQFGNKFWEPVQLKFCHSCNNKQRKALRFTFCKDCDAVGVTCSNCKKRPCCSKTQNKNDDCASARIDAYKSQFLAYAQKHKSSDLAKLDTEFDEAKSALDDKFDESKKKLMNDLEFENKSALEYKKELLEAVSNLKKNSPKECGIDRGIELLATVEALRDLHQENITLIKGLEDELEKLEQQYETEKSEITNAYYERVDERINYGVKLEKRVARMKKRS